MSGETKVIIRINPKDFTVSYEIEGIKGEKCTELTDILTRGLEVKEQKYLEEYLSKEELPVFSGEGYAVYRQR